MTQTKIKTARTRAARKQALGATVLAQVQVQVQVQQEGSLGSAGIAAGPTFQNSRFARVVVVGVVRQEEVVMLIKRTM